MSILAKISWRSLIKNKTKTIISTIGIFLSVFLLSTILILSTSYKTSLIATTISEKGDWHVFIISEGDKTLHQYIDEDIIESYSTVSNVGYSQIEEIKNNKKPYLHIAEVSNDYSILPIRLIEGNFPSTNSEIIIPENYAKACGKNIGDTLNLDIGKRLTIEDDYEISQNTSYLGKDEEYISKEFTAEYKITGICQTVDFIEYGMSPGYTLLSLGEGTTFSRAYIKLTNPSLANGIISSEIIANVELLDILGLKQGESTGKVFNALIAVLIIIIFLIAFILIYNSYMLTINERLKNYSLLTSLGANDKHLFLTTILENFFLALIILPIGIAFSYLVLRFSLNNIITILSNITYNDIVFKLNYSFLFVLEIFFIGLIMILISSMIPFLLNIKKNVIENLRQNEIIKIKPKKERNSNDNKEKKVELDFIFKNFKRYKNKYKFTIFSIIISIVLFISIDIFTSYAMLELEKETDIEYDISCDVSNYDLDYSLNTIFKSLGEVDGVNESWWTIKNNFGNYPLNEAPISEKAKILLDGYTQVNIFYIILEDNMYNSLLEKAGKDKNAYNDKNNLKVFAVANVVDYENEQLFPLFNSETMKISFDKAENAKIESIDLDITNMSMPIELSRLTYMNGIYLFLPLNMADQYIIETPKYLRMYFNCADHKAAFKQMNIIVESNEWDFFVYDNVEDFDKQSNTMNIISIFSMVFLGIAIIISILNIFNTVFTNILKRKKEFAMLTALGMLDNTINKIVVYENMIMSGLSILISIIITLILSFALRLAFDVNEFIYPIIKILILVGIYIIATVLACAIALKNNSKTSVIDSLKKDYC